MSSNSSPSSIFNDPAFEEQEPKAYPSLKQFWLLLPAMIGLWLALMFSLGIYVGVANRTTDAINYLIGPLSIITYVLLTAFAYWQKRKAAPTFVFSFRMPALPVMLLLMVIMPALLISFVSVSSWFHLQVWNTLMHSQDAYYPDSKLAIIICTVVITLLDHLLNRGILLDGLLKRYPPAVAILNSVLLTSLLYMSPVLICWGLLMNLLYSWIYYYTRSLLPCVWATFMYVIFASAIDKSPWQKLPEQGGVALTSIALVVLVTSALVLHKILNQSNK